MNFFSNIVLVFAMMTGSVVTAGSVGTCGEQSKCLVVTTAPCDADGKVKVCLTWSPDDCGKTGGLGDDSISHSCPSDGDTIKNPSATVDDQEKWYAGVDMCETVPAGDKARFGVKDGGGCQYTDGTYEIDTVTAKCYQTNSATICGGNNPQDCLWEFTTNKCSDPLCLHESTMVNVPGPALKYVKDIVQGDFVMNEHGQPVEVVHNARSGLATNFVRFAAGAFGDGEPSHDVLLTPGHHVKRSDGAVYQARDLLKVHRLVEAVKTDTPIPLYNLITENITFFSASGIKASSWPAQEYKEKHGSTYQLQ